MKKQNGSSALEGLLILVIVGILGFTGWYVLHVKQTADNSLNSSANTNIAVESTKKSSSSTQVTSQAQASPYAGWKSYTLKYEKISFKYPADWSLKDRSVATTGCTYPGVDEVSLTSPSKEQVVFHTGFDCSGDTNVKALDSIPINSLNQKLYLTIDSSYADGYKAPLFACLAKTSSPDSYADISSKNIHAASGTATAPTNFFCYYPYDYDTAGTFVPQKSVSSIVSSKDFATAELIFESMHY